MVDDRANSSTFILTSEAMDYVMFFPCLYTAIKCFERMLVQAIGAFSKGWFREKGAPR